MNSAEEISRYKENVDSYYSPTLSKRLLGYGYDLPEKSPKKDKKWSIGSFFRRKKKEESESSSEEDSHRKGFLGRKKKKSDKKKKATKTVGTFDHVVRSRNSHLYSNGFNTHEDVGIFSDPSGHFSGYGLSHLNSLQDASTRIVKNSSLDDVDDIARCGSVVGSSDVVAKRGRKGLTKVRAEARRVTLKGDSSSDEDSQISASSSRFRSDESLGHPHKESSVSRKSRAARTERYLKRHSKDGENPKDYLRLSKSDAENCARQWKVSDDNPSPSRSPPIQTSKSRLKTSFSSLSQSPSISGLSTIPPSHGSHSRLRVSNSTSNPSYKPPVSMNDYNCSVRKMSNDYLTNQRSLSCDANIHRSVSAEIEPEVIHVQFPLGKPNNRYRNLSLIDGRQNSTPHANHRQPPPPPPPRDPRRLVTAQYYDNVRPRTCCLDGAAQNKSKSLSVGGSQATYKFNFFNLNPNSRSTSEDHLPKNNIHLVPRPSSATPEVSQKYVQRQPEFKRHPDEYNYLADKKPRSRRPIFIQTTNNTTTANKSETQKVIDFWKQKDRERNGLQDCLKARKSPQIFTSQTHVQTQVFLPSVLQNDINSEKLANSTDSLGTNENPSTNLSPHGDTHTNNKDEDNDEELKRKSSNLEEALDELEAIYNSLRLGDEDLLERAEQREKDVATKKLREQKREVFPAWGISRGALSDSSFSYEPFESIDSPRRRRLIKKSQTIDRRTDDMAFRKMNKERSATINDPQSMLSKLSYLNASPVYGKDTSNDDVSNKKSKEPDVTLDDVVYRNVKYANNSPKVVEPQPPFGIPLGPIASAPNSDYLHAVPDNIHRPTFKPRKIPDLVKDDLAFRNLRKDQNKEEPALPPLSPDDLRNNNACESRLDLNSLKKKRAVRSLSANIGNLINKDILARGLEKYKSNNNSENKEPTTLTDIADAMEIARQVLKEKENKISATRKAFLSDTDTNNGNNDGLAENRMNFLNSLKTPENSRVSPVSDNYLQAKPPRGLTPERKSPRSPKESTPIEEKLVRRDDSRDSSLDDLLTALAIEARETNQRITNELKTFAEDSQTKNDSLNRRELNRTLSEIDAVSEQAKLCEKLLEGIVDSTDLMVSAPVEEVEQIRSEPSVEESVANIVLSRDDSKAEAVVSEKVTCESDHDYENLMSDQELNLEDVGEEEEEVKCTSPFEERKAELIATFQELKRNIDVKLEARKDDKSVEKESDETVTGKHSPRRSRSRLPRWLRPYSSGNMSEPATMSEGQESRAGRISRYKEQRRRELAAQFGPVCAVERSNKDPNSSGSEGPRTTRTSRLRAAATAQENCSGLLIEKVPASPSTSSEAAVAAGSRRVERDKSSKRKSNLNRSLNSEEVTSLDPDDVKNRRRRRRFFPQEVLDQTPKDPSSNDDKSKSDTNLTASLLSQSSASPITASPTTSRLAPRKSKLSIHMENARKGVTPFAEMGKAKAPTSNRRRITPPSSREKFNGSDFEDSGRRERGSIERNNKSISKKMEELTALTRETLARVERLACKNKEGPLKQAKRPLSSSPIKQIDSARSRLHQPSSILKKRIVEEAVVVETVPNAAPVSILKRKVSQDDHRSEGASSTHTPPVTFSPSVVEPATTNRKQGILKKRRSLDESQVMRHRSCSPDVANKAPSSSILKNQRRSSMEELTRTQSPEMQLHGILKRKTSKTEEDDHSLNSPQSILKRRSGASSAGSTGSTPHVSITTAVILAAAGGAEMILEPETVRPILKKKSLSEEHSFSESSYSETPKPILKKKSSTDTDECEERPKKPILKMPKNSFESADSNAETRPFSNFKHNIPVESECDVKSILKQNGSKEEGARPRLSFCGDRDDIHEETVITHRSSRRSHTICAEFNVKSDFSKEEDRHLRKPRPLSVSELVMNFENGTSTGAIPKKTSLKRSSERYRTQPVTSTELEASLSLVRSPQLEDGPKLPKSSPLCSPADNHSINSLPDFTSSLENDSNLNSFLSSLHNTSPDSGVCGKMSSDSAFQSLGDGLELDQDDEKPLEVPVKSGKLETSRLELQMKAIAEEAQKIKLGKGSAGVEKYRNRKLCPSERSASSRFSTQPVTFDEVQEASRINKTSDGSEDKDEAADPSNLSLFERIKLFNVKLKENAPQKRDVPRRRPNRFQTQPVTSDEVETARCISPNAYALDDEPSGTRTPTERRGILKSSFGGCRARGDATSPLPRSVLKKRDSFDGTSDYENASSRRSILKSEVADVTYDEGISCNDSASDSEGANVPSYAVRTPELKRTPSARPPASKFRSSSETSDGDSSGGREIRSIFKNENKLKVKQKLEGVLSKSQSQSAFGDESDFAERKTASSVRRSLTQSAMPRAIEEIQAKLQQSGESGWRRRVPQNNNSNDELRLLTTNRYNDGISERSILEIKKNELDAAAKQWENRVEKSDAEKFSVTGRMEKNREEANLPINIPSADHRRIPQAKRFKGKEGKECLSSTPVSPDDNPHVELMRSQSVPDPEPDSSGSESSNRSSVRKVSVSRPDDYTFKSFYRSIETKVTSEKFEVSSKDFDLVTRQSLLALKKNVQMQKRREASKNPVKALAMRDDIRDEYTEVFRNVAEKERRRLNIEKLAKSSNFAPAALAGLVSKEDFKSVSLKKLGYSTTLVPYKDVMLLHIKGRQHVQTRLVEPDAASINEGDSYVLVTPSVLYNYVGKYSNIIEQSRASDIINHIQQSGDLGCKEAEVVMLSAEGGETRHVRNFWRLLACDERQTFTSGGNPEEDGIYETNILSTNMIYRLDGDELVPWDEYWGKMPKVEMLEPTRVIVFDFGSELYVWSGKNAPADKKKLAFKLATEMWSLGYDYTDCNVCPLNVASILGNRPSRSVPKKAKSRPTWALFAKITQHRETILFKEKFLDWPDFSRIIKVKDEQNGKAVDPSYNMKACDVSEMLLKGNSSEPDLIIENLHLGRGDRYFDEETKRLFEFDTINITVWRISENHPEQLDSDSVGHFYNSDSYIIKWDYKTTVKGRELSGKPSKYMQAGRNRCVYFCWQGSNASINEKGSAALLTIELDLEKAPQIRVVQGSEPAAFLRLFRGLMVVHDGKRDLSGGQAGARLYLVKGEVDDEVCLIEVPCEVKQLRSRTSFVLIDRESAQVTLWHGCRSSEQKRKVAKRAVDKIVERKPAEFYWKEDDDDDDEEEDIDVIEMDEGEESVEFLSVVGDDRNAYLSLLNSDLEYNFTMRLFHLSSTSGSFKATEVLCPHRSEYSSPYPFLQTELYSASQPALFLIDNHHELWLWQGWWPEREEEESELSDQTGSGAVRWQAERKAAMRTAVDYWRKKSRGADESTPAFLVWAGLEPPEFKNLFPHWIDRGDVAELNLREGRKANAKLSVESELALLLRTTYPLSDLLQRPLPEGVDPTHLEIYLSAEDFQDLLNMTKEEFRRLPLWKQTAVKKEKGLF